MKFNTAVSSMMVFLNTLEKESEISSETYHILIKLLAPFAPHLTEELWELSGGVGSIHSSKWPVYDENMLILERVTIVVQINGKVRDSFEAPSGAKCERRPNRHLE